MTADRNSSGASDGTRAALIQAAQRVFARKGLDGATVKDLADEAGVNVSLVSYHFGGKEGLYRAALESVGRNRLEYAHRILGDLPRSKGDAVTRLRIFVEEFLRFHAENQEVSQILSRECPGNHALIRDIFEEVFLEAFKVTHRFIEEMIRKKWMPGKNRDGLIAAGFFYGSIIHFVRGQDVARSIFGKDISDPKTRAQIADQMVGIFFGEVSE